MIALTAFFYTISVDMSKPECFIKPIPAGGDQRKLHATICILDRIA